MSRKQRVPRLYFSFRSPYSWMAIEQLRRSLPDLFERVQLLPYWDPDPRTEGLLAQRDASLSYQQMSKAKHLYVLGDTKRMAARLGLAMAWPIDIGCWWERPHLGWLAARRAGQAQTCYDALVAARWARGEDICDAAVFARVTAQAGLDSAALEAASQHDGYLAEGIECLAAACEDDVFGVPYVRYGYQRFWGLDRMELFIEQFMQPGQAPELEPLAGVPAGISVGAYDRDTAGGCG